MTESQNLLANLRQELTSRLDDGEVRTLCFDVGVDYDSLSGHNKADKIRELLHYLYRTKQLSSLLIAGEKLRPDIYWGINGNISVIPKTAPSDLHLKDTQSTEGEDYSKKITDSPNIALEKDTIVNEDNNEILLPSPSEVKRLETPVAIFYRTYNLRIIAAFVVSIFLIILFISALFDGSFIKSFSIVPCLYSFLIFGGSIGYILGNFRSRVIIFPDRFECIKGIEKTSTSWNEVKEMIEIIRYTNSEYPIYHPLLIQENDNKINIDFELEKSKEFITIFREYLIPSLVDKFWLKYKSGKTVDFGTISVNQRHISNGKWALPWNQISDIIIDDTGMIQIIENDTKRRWYLAPFNNTPNAILLVTIVPALIEQNTGNNAE